MTEIIYAIGAESKLVGVDTTSLYPPSAQTLPSVGYARTLSLEGILALSPTLVIASEEAGPPAVMRQLTSSGVAISVLLNNHASASESFKGLLQRIKQVGQLTGYEAQAEALQQKLQQEWSQSLAHLTTRTTKPRILFIMAVAPNQVMVAGAKTNAQAMMELVQVTNAVDGFEGYRPLTPEAVIAANPDIILVTDQGLKIAGGTESILRLPAMAQTSAGRNRRVISLETMFLLGFGPRLPRAVAELDAAISRAMIP